MRAYLPDLRQVRALVAVVDEGSFSMAARRLQVTQSAVSHSLRDLEQSYDCKLLSRGARTSIPTEEGRIMAERGRRAFQELRSRLKIN
ncbi:LysR family transcriptional regulator [Luteolibacter flavescens]|uniref:LysR family transcriptional regulator n=1 Tax=Luteolibacter flavescens TaxID=1859460 RepID=A0ABT3FW84_9BACT|nr:LysR family transcriptional regulator [Luteolibacter flavescens]MCW1887846.1 LysR family transcriptional regulator [Luteolibacter flavescens]